MARSRDIERARALTNPDVSPHLEFIDMGGHGYSTVKVTSDAVETEFVAIPRPIQRSASPDGGPILYRVVHRASRWKAGERPKLTRASSRAIRSCRFRLAGCVLPIAPAPQCLLSTHCGHLAGNPQPSWRVLFVVGNDVYGVREVQGVNDHSIAIFCVNAEA